MKIKLLILSLFLSATMAMAQTGQGEYLEAKRLFATSQYRTAKLAFAELTSDPYFGSYATFYYGLSQYKLGDIKEAVDVWLSLQQLSQWDKQNEVSFWLAYAYFESVQYDKALRFTDKLDKIEKKGSGSLLIKRFLSSESLQTLKVLYDQHEENETLARIYFNKLNELTYAKRDFDEIKRVSAKWDFEDSTIGLDQLPLLKKNNYRVGVMLPFLYDETNIDQILQNTIVMELYQGMLIASEHLKENGINLELQAFDTKRNGQVTQAILNSLPDGYLDLIVGPLYPEPVRLVKAYSSEKAINMINPLSSTSEVIENNAFGYLFKPSQETMATKLAEYAAKEISNKNVMIFYEGTERDSVFAATYLEKIQEAGFLVIRYQELTSASAKKVLDELIEQKEVYYTKAEADSLLQIGGRFIKEKRLRTSDVERATRYPETQNNKNHPRYLPVSYDDNQRPIAYYENALVIGKDSIGHILGATSKNFLANNLISAVETMGDSTRLFGYGSWLDFTMVSYTQLERIGATLVHQDYIDPSSVKSETIKQAMGNAFKGEPSLYHFLGYELISQMGRLMKYNGVYYQRGLIDDRFYEGKIFEGIRYGAANDNQVVPLVKFENTELKVVNRESYEN